MPVASIPGNLPVPSDAPFDPFSVFGPLSGLGSLPGFTGGSASSDTGPQSSADIVSIPINSPFFIGDNNDVGGAQSTPTASATATQPRPIANDNLVVMVALAGLALVAFGAVRR